MILKYIALNMHAQHAAHVEHNDVCNNIMHILLSYK